LDNRIALITRIIRVSWVWIGIIIIEKSRVKIKDRKKQGKSRDTNIHEILINHVIYNISYIIFANISLRNLVA
jgi:hypothetical protein